MNSKLLACVAGFALPLAVLLWIGTGPAARGELDLWLGRLASNEGAPPRVRVEPPQVDLGRVAPSRVLHAEFTVRNTGGSRLVLNKMASTCDCLEDDAGQHIIPPGKAVNIPVVLHTRDMAGPLRLGLVYSTSDPEQPQLTLEVLAEVRGGG